MAWSTSSWSFAEPASAAHLAGAAASRTVWNRARPRHGGRRLTQRRCRPVLHAPAGRRRPTSDPSWTPQHRPASVVGAAARRTVRDRARPRHGGRRLTCRRCRPVLLLVLRASAPPSGDRAAAPIRRDPRNRLLPRASGNSSRPLIIPGLAPRHAWSDGDGAAAGTVVVGGVKGDSNDPH